MLLKERGARVIATDTIPRRLELALQSGAAAAIDPHAEDAALVAKRMTGGRGADIVILAAAAEGLVEQAIECSRPGARILLFAQTSPAERIELSGASICVGERILSGSYSASVDVQKQSTALVFGGKIPLHLLISHRMPLESIQQAFELAMRPTAGSLKIVVNPNG
jgi:L-iditol 2-dehydrogenase